MEEVKKEKMHQKMQLLYILTRELVLCKLFTGQNNLFQHFSNIFFRHKWVMKRTIVVYFDQLLGAARTRKLVELHSSKSISNLALTLVWPTKENLELKPIAMKDLYNWLDMLSYIFIFI